MGLPPSPRSLSQRVNIVVTCTKRKHVPPMTDLQLRDVCAADIQTGFAAWVERLSASASQPIPARSLYAGDPWSIVRTLEDTAAASGLDAAVWVCSAGYGLIGLDTEVKPYSATFSPMHPDTMCKWRTQPAGSASAARAAWWQLHTRWSGPEASLPRSLAHLTAKYPRVPLILVASQVYLKAMTEDLQAAAKSLCDPDLLCIISAGTDHLPGLDTYLLPCTAALQAEVGGSLHSLNVRLARAALAEARDHPLQASRMRARFAERVAAAPPRRLYQRKVVTDGEIRRYILNGLSKDPGVSWSLLLRRLRDGGRACRQERFSALFKVAKTRSVVA